MQRARADHIAPAARHLATLDSALDLKKLKIRYVGVPVKLDDWDPHGFKVTS